MSKLNPEDSIAALATPPGEGGLHVIRISGNAAFKLADTFFKLSGNKVLASQEANTTHYGVWRDAKGSAVDEVIAGCFRAPHSFTGEDSVEISCHGGMRIVRKILEDLYAAGARPAEPGEFTKRAFLHGKLDLTQAEAVLDLIRSRSEVSLQTALRQLQGSLSKNILHLKESLLHLMANFEAGIDFPEEHLDVFPEGNPAAELGKIESEVSSLMETYRRGLAAREGWNIVIIGRPNVGKSSLLNTLLRRERALVSPVPGTTRDLLEETFEIGGYAARLRDTAGLFNPDTAAAVSLPDQMAIQKTKESLNEGDLFLFVVDGSAGWTEEDEEIFSQLKGKNFLILFNKSDLPSRLGDSKLAEFSGTQDPLSISCLTGEGLEVLKKKIEDKISAINFIPESPMITRLRHHRALESAKNSITCASQSLCEGQSSEFVLLDLQQAVESLRELIGEVYSEDLLDVIFQEFCIGK